MLSRKGVPRMDWTQVFQDILFSRLFIRSKDIGNQSTFINLYARPPIVNLPMYDTFVTHTLAPLFREVRESARKQERNYLQEFVDIIGMCHNNSKICRWMPPLNMNTIRYPSTVAVAQRIQESRDRSFYYTTNKDFYSKIKHWRDLRDQDEVILSKGFEHEDFEAIVPPLSSYGVVHCDIPSGWRSYKLQRKKNQGIPSSAAYEKWHAEQNQHLASAVKRWPLGVFFIPYTLDHDMAGGNRVHLLRSLVETGHQSIMFVELYGNGEKRKSEDDGTDGVGVAIINPPPGFYNEMDTEFLPAVSKYLKKYCNVQWLTPNNDAQKEDDEKQISWFANNREEIDDPAILECLEKNFTHTPEELKKHYADWWNCYDVEKMKKEASDWSSYPWLLEEYKKTAQSVVDSVKYDEQNKGFRRPAKYPPKKRRIFKRYDWNGWRDVRPESSPEEKIKRYKRVP